MTREEYQRVNARSLAIPAAPHHRAIGKKDRLGSVYRYGLTAKKNGTRA